ncbi:hypothetical protein HYW35_02065 [Candidatus Saccharibacteria bacterium]|nr:hypothetical protein [Candidatus Saccharibacteria bacterium]
MDSRQQTSELVDGVLRFIAIGGTITASLVLPGLAIGLSRPLNKFLDSLDKRQRDRELKRILSYMKEKRLINYSPAARFEHGVTITKRGRQRLERANFASLEIKRPSSWDKKWRLVIFDIPEEMKTARDALTSKLYKLGFKPLQRSVWIYPFACHEEIEAVAVYYKLEDYLTYIETSYIDKPDKLKVRFRNIIRK